MRGRIYTVPIAFAPQTAAIDALEAVAAATGILALKRVVLANSSDAGDAEEEILQVEIKRAAGAYTSGSGGTTPTPVPTDQEGAASSFTAEVNNDTQAVAGSGTLVTVKSQGWNVRSEFLYIPDDGEEILVSPTDAVIVSISAPADSLTIGGFAVLEEVGT